MLSKMSGCMWKISGKCQNRPESVPKHVDSGHYLDTTANSGQVQEFFFHRDGTDKAEPISLTCNLSRFGPA